MAARILSLVLFCAVAFQSCFATPVAPLAAKRVQRSPQFGFPGEGVPIPEYPAYPGVGGLPVGGPVGPIGVPEFGAGGGFASANANADAGGLGGFGGFGGLGGIGGGQSEANAESGNINLGPLSASFSNAQASSDGFNI